MQIPNASILSAENATKKQFVDAKNVFVGTDHGQNSVVV